MYQNVADGNTKSLKAFLYLIFVLNITEFSPCSQNIQLIKVEIHKPEELPNNFQDCGSLAFQFSDESQQLSTPAEQLVRKVNFEAWKSTVMPVFFVPGMD